MKVLTGLPRLHVMTLMFRCVKPVTSKPIHGGAFQGQFRLVGATSSQSGFVPSSFFVVDDSAEIAIGMGPDAPAALADARHTLTSHTPESIAEFIRAKEVEWAAKEKKERLPSIKKRRAEIFNSTDGKCYYCDSALAFDGPWHVDHKQPKVHGGTDETSNLAPACGLCNLRKSRLTEAEFRAAYGLPVPHKEMA